MCNWSPDVSTTRNHSLAGDVVFWDKLVLNVQGLNLHRTPLADKEKATLRFSKRRQK
jgi:hypothetical protein